VPIAYLEDPTNHRLSSTSHIQSPAFKFSRKHLLPIEHLQATANPALFYLSLLSSKVRKFRVHTDQSSSSYFHCSEISQFCTSHVCCRSGISNLTNLGGFNWREKFLVDNHLCDVWPWANRTRLWRLVKVLLPNFLSRVYRVE
jgi:hypothetical protein